MISIIFNDNLLNIVKYQKYEGPIPLMLYPNNTILNIFNKYIIYYDNIYYEIIELNYLNKEFNIDKFIKEYPDLLDINQDIWDKLYNKCKEIRKEREISKYVSCGSVSASILTTSGHIYSGICIDTACTLGICAERNAIFNMLTNNDNEITKMLVLMDDDKLGIPCGACLELIAQIMPNDYKNILLMTNYKERKIIQLKELYPLWWGND